jgi:8-oxo-dGTP pyrophosphatase MutT (NUDIX family)
MGAWDYQAPFFMPERTLSAGVVVVRQNGPGWRVLLLRVYNYWDCPKGVVEPGEDILAAARREALEETGIGDLEFRWGEDYIETEPYSRNKVARYYLASTATREIKLPVNPALGTPEHHEAGWYDWDGAMRRVQPRLARVLAWARQRVTTSA